MPVNNTPPHQQPNDEFVPSRVNNTRIQEIRRRRKLRQLRTVAIIALVFFLVLAYFLGAFGTPLSMLNDFVDTVKISIRPGAGYPQNLSLSNITKVEALAQGTAILGNREMMIYSSHGNLLRRVPHGFARADMATSENRVALYSRGGSELNVESRTRNLYTRIFDSSILLAEMSDNGTLAVFTQNYLEVLDPLFETVWKWDNLNEMPLAMTFANDNKKLAVASLRSDGGGAGATIHFFNINSTKELASAIIYDGVPVKMQYIGNRLLVITDKFAALYDINSGEEVAKYSFGVNQLQSVSIDASGRTAILFASENYPDITSYVTLDASLNEIATVSVRRSASAISLINRNVYVLTNDSVLCYDTHGELTREITLTTKPLAVVQGSSTLLITQNAISELYSMGETEQSEDTQTESSQSESENSEETQPVE